MRILLEEQIKRMRISIDAILQTASYGNENYIFFIKFYLTTVIDELE